MSAGTASLTVNGKQVTITSDDTLNQDVTCTIVVTKGSQKVVDTTMTVAANTKAVGTQTLEPGTYHVTISSSIPNQLFEADFTIESTAVIPLTNLAESK